MDVIDHTQGRTDLQPACCSLHTEQLNSIWSKDPDYCSHTH